MGRGADSVMLSSSSLAICNRTYTVKGAVLMRFWERDNERSDRYNGGLPGGRQSLSRASAAPARRHAQPGPVDGAQFLRGYRAGAGPGRTTARRRQCDFSVRPVRRRGPAADTGAGDGRHGRPARGQRRPACPPRRSAGGADPRSRRPGCVRGPSGRLRFLLRRRLRTGAGPVRGGPARFCQFPRPARHPQARRRPDQGRGAGAQRRRRPDGQRRIPGGVQERDGCGGRGLAVDPLRWGGAFVHRAQKRWMRWTRTGS